MYQYCYYKNEDDEIVPAFVSDMDFYLENDSTEYLRVKKNAFLGKNLKTKLEYVSKGKTDNCIGFRVSNKEGNPSHESRGAAESPTHQIHVDAISRMNEIRIKVYNKDVKLYIKNYELDKTVYCNGNRYEVDIYFELEKTEPIEYYDYLKGILYFEVYHTCPVDSRQAEDFAIENLPLYEYKILGNYILPKKVNKAYLEERISKITSYILKYRLNGYPIFMPQEISKNRWYVNEKGNRVCVIDGKCYTIFLNNSHWYLSVKEKDKEVRYVEDFKYEGNDIEAAKKRADYIIFRVYNDYKHY